MDNKQLDLKKYGPWALIVGGSDGLGESFARKLGAQGFKLVLAARRPGPLNALAEDLRAQGVEVKTVSVDMTKPDGLDLIRTVTDALEIGLLIYNAGVVGGPADFVKQNPEQYQGYIALNVTGHAELSHHFGGLMFERRRGGILLVGSTGSFMGSPGLAIYCGVKAFSRIFSEGFWYEGQKYGVDVLHLCVAFTNTPTIVNLGLDVTHAQSSDVAALEGLDNLANGPIFIAGGRGEVESVMQRSLLPGRAQAIRDSVIDVGPSYEPGSTS